VEIKKIAATSCEIKNICLNKKGLEILFRSNSVIIVSITQRVMAKAPKLTPRSNILLFSPSYIYKIVSYLQFLN